MRFAVIGNPVFQSLSPQIHHHFADQCSIKLQYDRISGETETFEEQVRDFFFSGGSGLNVTAPFKECAFAMAEIPTPRCQQARAANTLWMQNGVLYADNTDGIGFVRDIARFRSLSGKSLLLLGAGGAVRGLLGALFAQKPEKIVILSHSPEKSGALRADFPQIALMRTENMQAHFDIVINSIPASVFHETFFPEKAFGMQTLAYDLGYNRTRITPFVAMAKSKGHQAVDGLGMLIEQAAEAFKIWHKCPEATLNHLIFDQLSLS